MLGFKMMKDVIERLGLYAFASFVCIATSCVINQDLPHGSDCCEKEMSPIVCVVDNVTLQNPQACLVHQRGGLQTVSRSFATQHALSNRSKLDRQLVEERVGGSELSSGLATFHFFQEKRNVCRLGIWFFEFCGFVKHSGSIALRDQVKAKQHFEKYWREHLERVPAEVAEPVRA